MLAAHPTAKRKIDDHLPALDLDTTEFNACAYHIPILPYKRTRLLRQPCHLAPEWGRSLATDVKQTVYDGPEPCTTANTSFSCVPSAPFPYYLNPVEGAAFGDMPAKRPRPRPPRQPLPGVNPPRLATTWRETTSSRGAENTFMVGAQGKSNDVTAFTSNVSSSGIVTDDLESPNVLNVTECESSSALEFNDVRKQQTVDPSTLTLSRPPGTEERELLAPDSTDPSLDNIFGLDYSINPHPYLFESDYWNQTFGSWPERAAGGSRSIAHNSQNSSLIEMPESNLGGDLFGNLTIFPTLGDELDFLNPRISIQESITSSSEVGRTLEREDIGIQTGSTQLKFCCPKINDHFNVGEPLQDILQHNLSEFSSEDSSAPWLPQPSVSTSSTFCVGSNDDARGNKTHDNATVLKAKRNTRKLAYHSRELQSWEAIGSNLGSSTPPPTDQLSKISSDTHSNKVRIVHCHDWLQGIDSHENFNQSTISNDSSLRMHNQPDTSGQKTLQAGPRFSTKLLNLKNGGNNDSPVMVVMEDTNATQSEVQEFLAKANQQSKPQKSRSSRNSPPRKVETTWEHIFIPTTHFTEAESEPPPRSTPPKGTGRTRPLKVETRAKAKEMRKIRSCMRCKVAKIACNPGEICVPCLKALASMMPCKLCVRAHLKDYLSLFLPERAVRPFQKASIDQVMENKISGFGSSEYKVCLSSGPSYPPILLTVQAFRTKDPSFSVLKKIVSHGEDGAPAFVEFYSPLLGITDFTQDLEGKLRNHIKGIIEGQRNIGEVSYGNTSRLTWEVHEAVRQYQCATQASQLLRKALKLYAMQFFMTKTIVVLPGESDDISEHLHGPSELNLRRPNLRMISIQIKHIMYSLIRETYVEVLEELEENLRPKDLASWTPSFCCILILCMCAEMVQITTDHRVVCALDDMSKSPDGRDKNGNTASREDSYDVCHQLDDLPIASAESNFHVTYKSTKLKDSTKREQGFNPIRDGVDAVRKAKLGLDVEEFVGRILDIMEKYRSELKKEATIPSLNKSPNILEVLKSHEIFRKHNSGRLVSRFLLSMV